MNLFSRHKNTVVLATVLLAQLLALAVQVKRQTAEGPVRLIRLVTVSTIAPFERMLIYMGGGVRGVWSNYIDLRDVRRENQQLKAESDRMRLERAREQEDARQARRIQALLGFKEQWIDTTVAAQVIGTSGSENSRLLYLDKGAKDGIKVDMPVITPDGVVGKILNVYGETAQVLMINDPTSGVGATLVNSRLQGIVKGTNTGEVQLNYIMSDEAVQAGEPLVTSGGDGVFPKGLPVGTVAKASPGRNLFLDIKLKTAADLDRLEEVLVITQQKARTPDTNGLGPIRASDILAQHLPGVPQTPPPGATNAGTPAAGTAQAGSANQQAAPVAGGAAPVAPKAPVAQGAGSTTPKAQTATQGAGANASASNPQAAKSPGTPVVRTGAATGAAKTTTGSTSAGAVPKSTASKPETPKPTTPKPATPKPTPPNASGAKPGTAQRATQSSTQNANQRTNQGTSPQ